jgi:putative peptidoglycan lipid II flippase
LPLGPLGLAAGASLGAWIEWALLRRALTAHVGVRVGAGASPLARMFTAALAAAAGGYAAERALTTWHPLLEAAVVAAVFGAIYVAVAAALKLEQAGALLQRLRRRKP